MMTIFRHVLTSIAFGILLTITVISITFIVFPLTDWKILLQAKVYNVSYLVVIITSTIIFSSIIGIITSVHWKQRIDHVERQLTELNNDQALSKGDTFKELKKIEKQLVKLQEKFRLQVEHSQRIATERAKEREKSLQEVVEQERSRFARDLHDSVSQQLFAASMMMSALNESPIEDLTVKHQIQMVEKTIHQSQLEMRALLLHLRPAALKGKVLHEGIKDLLTELRNRIPLKVDWKIESFHVEKGVEDQLFRIVQEAISNTLRHAKASSIHVLLIKRDHKIILRVVDDGKGFNAEKIKTSSYGLQNMDERAQDLGGTLKIISLPNKGTRLEVKVPSLDSEGGEEA